MKLDDAVRFFLHMGGSDDTDENDDITNMKLNKLLFFAQAASLQRFGRTLFDEPLEAWTYGPIVPQVYRQFKQYGRAPIPKDADGLFDRGDYSVDELRLLCDVYLSYKPYTAKYLMEMTHLPGTPWRRTHDVNPSGTISVSDILEWVQANPLPIDRPHIPDGLVYHPPLSAQGHVILPDDWDED